MNCLAKGKGTVAAVMELAQPVAERMGLLLWDVRFEKEGANWYLRLLIDREDGGVTIDDCEVFSREMDPLLDEADPISQSYVLEVGSPGTERDLTKDWHFARMLGKEITVRLIRPMDGKKEVVGRLTTYQDGTITLLPRGENTELTVLLSDTAFVRQFDDYFMGGLEP